MDQQPDATGGPDLPGPGVAGPGGPGAGRPTAGGAALRGPRSEVSAYRGDAAPTPAAPEPTPRLLTYDILPTSPTGPPDRAGVGRWTVVGVLAVVAALVLATVVVGLRLLSGGGAQPEDRLPATAFAYARLDLDPSAGQKLDAIRFLRSFPQTKGAVSDGSDLRRLFFQAASPAAAPAGLDYGRDVEPWLGSRIGVALLPATGDGQSPTVVAALQVRDEGKARTALTRLRATGGGARVGFVVQGGWAVLAPDEAQARAAIAAAATAPLSSAAHWRTDLKRLGDPGIVTAWVDADRAGAALRGLGGAAGSLGAIGGLGAVGPLAQLGSGTGASAAHGRLMYALRFAGPKVLELTGFATDTQGLAGASALGRGLTTLPATTVAAVGVSGLDRSAGALWSQVRALAVQGGGAAAFDAWVRRVKAQYGISLPGDLGVLLGHETTVAVDGTGLSLERTTPPGIGVRAVTDPARGAALAQKLVALGRSSGLPFTATVQRTGDGYVLATDAAEASRLAAKGSLGQRADFRAALPDIGTAQAALWIDVDGLATALDPSGGGASAQALRTVDAVGVTGGVSGGSASFRVRLVIH